MRYAPNIGLTLYFAGSRVEIRHRPVIGLSHANFLKNTASMLKKCTTRVIKKDCTREKYYELVNSKDYLYLSSNQNKDNLYYHF